MATFNTPNVGTEIVLGKMKQVKRGQNDNSSSALGLFEFDSGVITVPSTAAQAADVVYVLTFPGNCRIVDLVYTSSDRDTDASPAIVEDIIVTTPAAVSTVLINDTTVGQAGGSVLIDTAKKYFDCSSSKLGVVVGTSAATAASGTIRFRGVVSVGKSGYGVVSFPASTAA